MLTRLFTKSLAPHSLAVPSGVMSKSFMRLQEGRQPVGLKGKDQAEEHPKM